MSVYDAQGNVIAEILEDPLVHVEDHDVGGIVNGPPLTFDLCCMLLYEKDWYYASVINE